MLKTPVSQQRMLSTTVSTYQGNLDDYCMGLVAGLSEVWRITKQSMMKAQCRQKKQYDQQARDLKLQVGDCVMVFIPQEMQGKWRKLALSHHGPYRVLESSSNVVCVRPVEQPDGKSIVVNRDWVIKCPTELLDTTWMGPKRRKRQSKKNLQPRNQRNTQCRNQEVDVPVRRSPPI